MNFDFPDVELIFRLAAGRSGPVFYLCFEWNGAVNEVAGMNTAGLFSAAQILVAHFEIEPPPREDLVRPYEIFSHALKNSDRIAEVLEFLGERRLGYTTLRKGHQLYADRFGNTCVLEPSPQGNRIYCSSEPFAVLANRPLKRELERAAAGAGQPGADRFQTAHSLIREKLACGDGNHGNAGPDFRPGRSFHLEDGLEILRRTALTQGRFTTQSSMVCDPQAGEIYLALHRDFSRLWKLSLIEGTIETFSGFSTHCKLPVGDAGVAASYLSAIARE